MWRMLWIVWFMPDWFHNWLSDQFGVVLVAEQDPETGEIWELYFKSKAEFVEATRKD